jgi:very-short-patch-repair endonuclease
MDITDAFRGSTAVAAGLVGRGALRGPRFQRLFPDVYLPAGRDATLAVRSRAAYLLVEPEGVLSGYSAAELLGASSGPPRAPAEVTCPRHRRRRPGLLVHRGELAADEIVLRDGFGMTTPERTAYDLARWRDLTSAVAAVDALAHRYPFELGLLRAMRSRHLAAHASSRIEKVLALVDRRAESPMESRMRVALVLGGLAPEVQFRVVLEGFAVRLDLAFPAARLGVEFDGGHHRTAEQARRDLHREAALTRAGWKVLRFDAWTVLQVPQLIVDSTRSELALRAAMIATSAPSGTWQMPYGAQNAITRAPMRG